MVRPAEDLIRRYQLTVDELQAAEELLAHPGPLSYRTVCDRVTERRAGRVYAVILAMREERDGPDVGVDPRRVLS